MMQNTQQIEEKIGDCAAEILKLPRDQLTPTTLLRDLPGVESIKMLRVIAKIESLYDIELEDEVVFRIKTIAELAETIAPLVEKNSRR